MRLKINLLISLTLTLFYVADAYSLEIKDLRYTDHIYKNNIKTVKLSPQDFELAYPIINLNNINPLQISFDQIESQFENYYYSIIHCSYDWQASNLIFIEYASGFEENELNDYENSINTTVPYTHFKLQIPNNNLEFKKSGNYLLVVYTKENDENIPVISKRFMVYENLITLKGEVNKGFSDEGFGNYQKPEFAIGKKGLNSLSPESDIKVTILQNYQWNTAKFNVPYSFSDNDKIVYNSDTKLSFNANNEYRQFSFTRLDLYSEQTESIEYKNPYYYINLFKDKSEMITPYKSISDMNGGFIIRAMKFGKQSPSPEVEAEYSIVNFRLDYKQIITDADIYLYGELSNYSFQDEYKMKYNPENKSYENMLFLKQGYYNYRYVLVNKDNKKLPNHSFFEGSHLQTENNYLILVYYKRPSDNYYRIINLSILNSRNN